MKPAPLSREEQYELAERWRSKKDKAARDKLVMSLTGLIKIVAKRHAKQSTAMELEDLIQEGYLGAMRAVETFDPERGCMLSTYAIPWIEWAMSDAVANLEPALSIPTQSYRAARKRAYLLGQGLTREEADARMSPRERNNADKLGGASTARAASISEAFGNRSDAMEEEPAVARVPDPSPSVEEVIGDRQEHEEEMRLLRDAMATLTDRERAIFIARHLTEDPPTLEQLGGLEEMRWSKSKDGRKGVSRERIRQLEARA
ncbi:MAG TPA: sigma-70 family RNA polymerase sigma factor, partial [Salinarimonas sp.]|nr:sigma-70 family RNA polymerase sigma factor [Salinarimonas sp.]